MPGTAPADDIPAGPRASIPRVPGARVLDFARRRPTGTNPATTQAPDTVTVPDDGEATRQQTAEWWLRAFAEMGLDLADPQTARVQAATLGMVGILIKGGVAEWERNTSAGVPPEIAERLFDLLHTGIAASDRATTVTDPATS